MTTLWDLRKGDGLQALRESARGTAARVTTTPAVSVAPQAEIPAPQQAAPTAESRSAFVIHDADQLSPGQRKLVDSIAAQLQAKMPVLLLHNVFGQAANHLVMRGTHLAVQLGPQCGGSNCAGGEAGKRGTVHYIDGYLASRPEFKDGSMTYQIVDLAGTTLASGPR